MHSLRDVEGNILPSDYGPCIHRNPTSRSSSNLGGEHPSSSGEILHKAPEATEDDVTTFQLLFKLQYPGRVIENTTLNVDAEISKLSHQAGENLGTYYERANSHHIQVGSRDRETLLMTKTEALKGKFAPLSPSENTVLDSVIDHLFEAFVS